MILEFTWLRPSCISIKKGIQKKKKKRKERKRTIKFMIKQKNKLEYYEKSRFDFK